MVFDSSRVVAIVLAEYYSAWWLMGFELLLLLLMSFIILSDTNKATLSIHVNRTRSSSVSFFTSTM